MATDKVMQPLLNQATSKLTTLMIRNKLRQLLRKHRLVAILLPLRQEAAIHLQKIVRGWLVRKELFPMADLHRTVIVHSNTKDLSMAGSFTQPRWSSWVPMSYSKLLGRFYYTFTGPCGVYHLKFIANGKWFVNANMPTITDAKGHQNNIFGVGPKFQMGAHFIPKKGSSHSADAYFTSQKAFGIADGVGEWIRYGLDPSEFSQELMNHAKVEAKLGMNSAEDLERCLWNAHSQVKSYGSSTALVAAYSNTYLRVLSLGDSALIVIRRVGSKCTVLFKTVEQNHCFNCPYQLAKLPTSRDFTRLEQAGCGKLVELLKKAKRPLNDCAYDAEYYEVPLVKGDVVLAATDGLFDNLYLSDIVRVVEECQDSQEVQLASCIAHRLVDEAAKKRGDSMYVSPFARNAVRSGHRYIGGKNDDILALCAVCMD